MAGHRELSSLPEANGAQAFGRVADLMQLLPCDQRAQQLGGAMGLAGVIPSLPEADRSRAFGLINELILWLPDDQFPPDDLEYLEMRTRGGDAYAIPRDAPQALRAMIFEGLSVDGASARFDLTGDASAQRFLREKLRAIFRSAICDLKLPANRVIQHFKIPREEVLAFVARMAANAEAYRISYPR